MIRKRLIFRRLRLERSSKVPVTIPNNKFYDYSHRTKKDQTRRLGFYLEEFSRLQALQLITSLDLSPRIPLNSKAPISLIRNRCIYTNRPLGVFSRYKMSRIVLKSLIQRGYWSGWRQI